VGASNNAGDTAWHWASNMMMDDALELLEKKGADKDYRGRVIVPEHIPKAGVFVDPGWTALGFRTSATSYDYPHGDQDLVPPYTRTVLTLSDKPHSSFAVNFNLRRYRTVKDFYDLPDGMTHPKPSMEFLESQKEKDRLREVAEHKHAMQWSK
jgi:hypothetical protein